MGTPKKLDAELFGGGVVKATGGNAFRGLGIVFTAPPEVDCEGEFFSSKSDFWLEDRLLTPVLWGHGRDPTIGKARLGSARWFKTEEGIVFEGSLAEGPHTKEIMQLVAGGEMGLSTAGLSPWVERVKMRGGTWLKTWPVYELSIVASACEPKTTVGIKSFHHPSLRETVQKCAFQGSAFERQRNTTRQHMLRAISETPELFSDEDKRRWGYTTRWMNEQRRKRAVALDHYGKKQAEGLASVARLQERYESLIADEESKRQRQMQDEGRRAAMRVRWNG